MQRAFCRARPCALALVLSAGAALAQPDAGSLGGAVARFDQHRVVRVQLKTVRDFQTAHALTDDVWSHDVRLGGAMDIRVTPEQYAALVASGINHEVLIPDLQAAIDQEAAEINARRLQDGLTFYEDFRTYDQIKAYCQQLAADHPQRAQFIILGNSYQNREIFGLRITSATGPATKPGAIFFACQHAREWATPPTAVYLAEMLLEEYPSSARIQHLVDNVEFFIVPIVNPDGYVYTWTNNRMWRKNRKPVGGGCTGTDLNRNWGHNWGGQGANTNPCNDTYRGPSAFSEPETQVLRDFVLARPNIAASLDIHSYGQLIMTPWAYTEVVPPHHPQFMAVNAAVSSAIFDVHGRDYTYGPIFSHLYPASGCSVDWFYGAHGAWAFTTEVRAGNPNGFLLPAAEILPNAEENYQGELVIAEYIAPVACYANCDQSTSEPRLNVSDFSCFLSKFAAGDPYANCDNSNGSPILNVADFSCFLTKFAAGCP